MHYHLEIRSYNRILKKPLRTSRESITERSGFVIRLSNHEGVVAFGEIAPMPRWNTETLEEALEYLNSMPRKIDVGSILSIPNTLPCCQFAWSSACENLINCTTQKTFTYPLSKLIPLDITTTDLKLFLDQGYQTFKLKIGISDTVSEQKQVEAILSQLPHNCRLRLDANGGLSLEETKHWLEHLDHKPIEFLEQPLPVGHENDCVALSKKFTTPIALDESASSFDLLQQLELMTFTGPIILKPSTLGSIHDIRSFLQQTKNKIILSSSLESPFGIYNCIQLANALKQPLNALGFGVQDLFLPDPLHCDWLNQPTVNTHPPLEMFQSMWTQLTPV